MRRVTNTCIKKLDKIETCSRRSVSDNHSSRIRQRFLEYFINNHNHTFIRSSPVFPYHDSTVPFVNAGMNQFKGVFLGIDSAPCQRATNSQKCIRITGKHNDLNSVGRDGHHHTFFEMLGNWSFGDYFKYEACEMAWHLLTGSFGLNPQRLYVTYFGGDKILNLDPDLETKEVWRKIGVSENRILPFGTRDNFWEMGTTGPCGPCTEIHIDHVPGRDFVADRVNKGFPDVTELWNLVFIQYNRNDKGELKRLCKHHVDTGMGFERLVALLQGKQSNYDTDLFMPLFEGIEKISGAPTYSGQFNVDIDYAYRLLADHARMSTVALADGIFPDQNSRLRRILRKSFLTSEQYFGISKGMMKELTNYVAETLADAYPEICKNLNKIQLIVEYEETLFHSLRENTHVEWQKIVDRKPELKLLNVVEIPGLVSGFQYLESVAPRLKESHLNNKNDEIDAKPSVPMDVALKLFQSHGLDVDTIEQLSAAEGLEMDVESFEVLLNDIKSRSKETSSSSVDSLNYVINHLTETDDVRCTDDSYKYEYSRTSEGKYLFPPLTSMVTAIIVDTKLVPKLDDGAVCEVIVDRTNLYYESGGQSSDTGFLILSNGVKVPVSEVKNICGYILHKVTLPKNCELKVGDSITLEVDVVHRLGNMRNHTATHLVNGALRQILPVTYQKSSDVNSSYFTFDFSFYGDTLKTEDVINVEKKIVDVIKSQAVVKRQTVTANQLLAMEDITLVPGMTYPEGNIHIIEIETDCLKSKEACCGTHVLNTGDIGKFHIVNLRTVGTGTKSLRAVTGDFAHQVGEEGLKALRKVNEMKIAVDHFLKPQNSTAEGAEELNDHLVTLKRQFSTHRETMPYSVYIHSSEAIENLCQKLKDEAREFLRDSLRLEMKRVLDRVAAQGELYLVHFLSCSSTIDDVPLLHGTRLCPDLPIILLCRSEGVVKARCCVPESLVTQHFNAQLWMKPVLKTLKAQGGPPRGQNPDFVYNMKKKKIPDDLFEALIEAAINEAREFAEQALHRQSVKFKTEVQ